MKRRRTLFSLSRPSGCIAPPTCRRCPLDRRPISNPRTGWSGSSARATPSISPRASARRDSIFSSSARLACGCSARCKGFWPSGAAGGGVEGDSASSAELYALLSALVELPLRQDLAVTGSVNQQGEVQAIGGVNEKIEGFFDICDKRGLTGTQGVLIPAANVQHLMLRADVIAACAGGKFAIYPVSTIDHGIALLTGRPAGERGSDGLYPAQSLNRAVGDRLHAFARIRQSFGRDEHAASESRP
jgi:hypothetical protein